MIPIQSKYKEFPNIIFEYNGSFAQSGKRFGGVMACNFVPLNHDERVREVAVLPKDDEDLFHSWVDAQQKSGIKK